MGISFLIDVIVTKNATKTTFFYIRKSFFWLRF